MTNVATIDGPLIAPGDADRPAELVGGKGERWFGWGYHHTILATREREGVKEVLIARDKAPLVAGSRRGAHWIAAWRLQRYCTRTEAR